MQNKLTPLGVIGLWGAERKKAPMQIQFADTHATSIAPRNSLTGAVRKKMRQCRNRRNRERTRKLMIEYHKRLLQGEGRGEVLRQVRLKMFAGKKRHHPYYWASFIQLGEWANLNGKR